MSKKLGEPPEKRDRSAPPRKTDEKPGEDCAPKPPAPKENTKEMRGGLELALQSAPSQAAANLMRSVLPPVRDTDMGVNPAKFTSSLCTGSHASCQIAVRKIAAGMNRPILGNDNLPRHFTCVKCGTPKHAATPCQYYGNATPYCL